MKSLLLESPAQILGMEEEQEEGERSIDNDSFRAL